MRIIKKDEPATENSVYAGVYLCLRSCKKLIYLFSCQYRKRNRNRSGENCKRRNEKTHKMKTIHPQVEINANKKSH
ncbi:hypothetical protein GCM10007086_20630 [Photobacterium aphoticum]|nr:hypothetical protein GCM10007086_20630 [Photobacterium aphoticum]